MRYRYVTVEKNHPVPKSLFLDLASSNHQVLRSNVVSVNGSIYELNLVLKSDTTIDSVKIAVRSIVHKQSSVEWI